MGAMERAEALLEYQDKHGGAFSREIVRELVAELKGLRERDAELCQHLTEAAEGHAETIRYTESRIRELELEIQHMKECGPFQAGFIECKVEAEFGLYEMADRMERMRSKEKPWDAIRTAAAHICGLEIKAEAGDVQGW